MLLFPRSSGIAVATQLLVPLASPSDPVEFSQLTRTTPAPSLALPNRVMVASDVAKMVEAGHCVQQELASGVQFAQRAFALEIRQRLREARRGNQQTR